MESYGFSRTNFVKKEIPKLSDGYYYIEQPYGTQKFPDFLIINIVHNQVKILNFELKKGNSNVILWNDGFPQENSIYLYQLFTSKSITQVYIYV